MKAGARFVDSRGIQNAKIKIQNHCHEPIKTEILNSQPNLFVPDFFFIPDRGSVI